MNINRFIFICVLFVLRHLRSAIKINVRTDSINALSFSLKFFVFIHTLEETESERPGEGAPD